MYAVIATLLFIGSYLNGEDAPRQQSSTVSPETTATITTVDRTTGLPVTSVVLLPTQALGHLLPQTHNPNNSSDNTEE